MARQGVSHSGRTYCGVFHSSPLNENPRTSPLLKLKRPLEQIQHLGHNLTLIKINSIKIELSIKRTPNTSFQISEIHILSNNMLLNIIYNIYIASLIIHYLIVMVTEMSIFLKTAKHGSFIFKILSIKTLVTLFTVHLTDFYCIIKSSKRAGFFVFLTARVSWHPPKCRPLNLWIDLMRQL